MIACHLVCVPKLTIAAGLVTVKPGGIREMHWHPNASEWQFYLAGKTRMTVFMPPGRARTMDFNANDVGYVPAVAGHYIENTGDTDLVFLCSICAGLVGALTGLGGGIVVTPALTLLLGVDIRYAIEASLISVIATSSGGLKVIAMDRVMVCPSRYASLRHVLHTAFTYGSRAGRRMALTTVGGLLLMLTPIARVLLSLLVFLRAGDKLAAAITLAVLGALGLSILIH